MDCHRRAASLVEVLIASIVMLALVLPLLVVFSSTIRMTEVSIQEVWAQHLASEVMEQLEVLPLSVGYEWLFDRPFPNPPPEYPNYLSMAPDGELACLGMVFPREHRFALNQEVELSTDGWTKNGAAITYDTTVPPDPDIEESSRLFLSPLPDGFRRYLQIYHPIRSLSPLSKESNLIKAVVKIEWKSSRSSRDESMRRIELRSLISNPRLK